MLLVRPNKEQFLEYMRDVALTVIQKKKESHPCYKDSQEVVDFFRNMGLSCNTQAGEPAWAYAEGKLQGMCIWFGWEIEEKFGEWIIIKRGNKIILDTRQIEL